MQPLALALAVERAAKVCFLPLIHEVTNPHITSHRPRFTNGCDLAPTFDGVTRERRETPSFLWNSLSHAAVQRSSRAGGSLGAGWRVRMEDLHVNAEESGCHDGGVNTVWCVVSFPSLAATFITH